MTRIDLYKISPDNVSPKLEKKLRKLSYSSGQIFSEFKICQEKPYRKMVFLAVVNNKVVGWALRYPHTYSPLTYEIQLFVHKKYRRKGVGTSLVQACAYRIKYPLHTLIWNQRSDQFYDSKKVSKFVV